MKIFRIFMIFAVACIFESIHFAAYAHQGRYVVICSGSVKGAGVRYKKIIVKSDCISTMRRTKITMPEFATALACSAISGGGVVLADVEGEDMSLSVKMDDLDGTCMGCRNLFVESFSEKDGLPPAEDLVGKKFSGSGKAMLDKNGNMTAGRAEIKFENNHEIFFERPASSELIFDIAWAYLEQ